MLRRRRLPPELAPLHEAFLRVAALVDGAADALMAGVPTGRSAGRPLAEALAEFEAGLVEARAGMAAWRAEAVEREWQACRAGLEEALAGAEDLRTRAPRLGFESLLAAVGGLIGPLEAFHAAAERFLDLRRRGDPDRTRGAPPPPS